MRDLASLYAAWNQMEAYRRRGLKPEYNGAVFTELHVSSRDQRTQPGARMAAALFLEKVFKPRQPQFWRLGA